MSIRDEGAAGRRRFLQVCAATAGIALLGAPQIVLAKAKAKPKSKGIQERRLSFYNLHTGESLKTTYWVQGEYLRESLTDINHILRDFRNDEIRPIAPELLDLLHDMRAKLGSGQSFHIISGYRSPATNEMLSELSDGVARRSLHMDGMAIDIRMPGKPLSKVRKTALSMKRGGVGYYPKSDFVHLDVGRHRWWVG